MPPVPKCDEVRRDLHELVLGALTRRRLAQAREAERVEDVRIGIERLVAMERPRRRGHERALGYERPITESDILEGQTRHRR